VPQIATVGLVGGVPDNGAIGVEETTDGLSAAEPQPKELNELHGLNRLQGLLRKELNSEGGKAGSSGIRKGCDRIITCEPVVVPPLRPWNDTPATLCQPSGLGRGAGNVSGWSGRASPRFQPGLGAANSGQSDGP